MADRIFVRLAHRAVIEMAGEERLSFLQGLISNDINKASPERALFAALLTPQGKFLFDLFIVARGDTLLIESEAGRIEDLRKKLSLYKLRSKVTITVAEGLSVWALPGGGLELAAEAGAAAPFAGGIAFVDPRLAAAGQRVLIPAEGAEAALTAAGLVEGSFDAWDRARIALGLPDGSRDLPVEKAILLENGFDELNGVDFTKGCYMGQELTARTKYRGLVRKRLMPVALAGGAPETGAEIRFGEAEAGELRSVCGDVGLAMIRLEHFRAGEGGGFTCAGATVTASRPGWAVFPETD
jgi:folate-binding protein YgfZ